MKNKNFEDLKSENFICSTTLVNRGYSIFAYEGEKDDEIDVYVFREPDQEFMCSCTLLHDNKDIDCFIGDVDKNKVVMPIIKELVKHGYTY